MHDFIHVIVFIAAYLSGKFFAAGSEIYIATSALIISAVGQLIWFYRKDKKIEKKILLTNLAIIILGAITLLFRNPLIIQLKPTIVDLIIAAVFFISAQFFGKNLSEKIFSPVFNLPANLWEKLNFAWVIFFIFKALLNIFIVKFFSIDFWVGFKFWGFTSLTILFLAAQFFFLRKYLKRDEND